MADDHQRLYRAHDPYRRSQPSAGEQPSSDDPLAELARLIGQDDSFAASSRDEISDAGARDPGRTRTRAAEWYPGQPDPFLSPSDPRAASAGHPEGYHDPSHRRPPTANDQFYDTRDYRKPADSYPPSYGGADYEHPNNQGYETDPYYDEQDNGERYEDSSSARRRGGLLTVMAVLALAVIGTAAAFGYRAVFGSSGTVTPPPVIKADTTPNKIVPASTSNEATSKLIYDRVGDRNQTERVVVREEQPVDVKDATRSVPRVVLPGSGGGLPVPVGAQTPTANATASVASTTTEPKRIRTVTIRPDQLGGPEPGNARAAASPVSRVASSSPIALPAPSSAVARDSSTQVAATAKVAAAPPSGRPSSRVQSSPPSANAPLSLAPPSTARPSASRATPVQTASAPASRGSGIAETGGYTVQVSSQRSQAEAETSFHALQTKFPNILGGRQPIIRRADLGSKGIYFRVQVGPFGSSEQASEFCGNLKAAGGQCVVQRN